MIPLVLTWKAVSWLPSPYHTKVCKILCGLGGAILSVFFGLITLKIDTLPYFKAPFQAAPMDIRLLLFRALY